MRPTSQSFPPFLARETPELPHLSGGVDRFVARSAQVRTKGRQPARKRLWE